MRGNRRAILVDIHEKKLDPKKSYTKTDKSGHLSDLKVVGSKQPIFASSISTSVEVEQEEKVEIKKEVVITNVKEILVTQQELVQQLQDVETFVSSTSQELKIDKNQKKKKKQSNQD